MPAPSRPNALTRFLADEPWDSDTSSHSGENSSSQPIGTMGALCHEADASVSLVASVISGIGWCIVVAGGFAAAMQLGWNGGLYEFTVGLSAAISGILMVGFGEVIEYLARIARYLSDRC